MQNESRELLSSSLEEMGQGSKFPMIRRQNRSQALARQNLNLLKRTHVIWSIFLSKY